MRNVEAMWETWRSGVYVGDTKPCTRVTVESSYRLRATGPILGQWTRGPARWFQRTDQTKQIETEIPNILNVSVSRSLTADAASCDITIANTMMPGYGESEVTRGEFGENGYFTWDHGSAQEARSRWGHRTNPWNNVLVPNALLRTYTGFGGHDKSLAQAQTDGNLVLYGVWLVDDVQVSSDGTIQLRCRDMAKLLIDQGLYPPLVPKALHPLRYYRWRTETFKIDDSTPPAGSICYQATYVTSSTDATYGETNTQRTGHPPGEAFDISTDPPNSGPGEIAHQRTYWMSEPKVGPGDHVWIEFGVDAAHAGSVNLIYYHAWGGNYTIQVSVWENGQWVAPEAGGQGGVTADGIPYVHFFSPVWEGGQPPGLHPNTYALPRDYHGTKIRLTISNLIKAPEGGFRAGARKIMACFDQAAASYPRYTFAGAARTSADPDSVGYWQVRSDGRVFAFGDARVFAPTSPATTHASAVIAMEAHTTANGYWTLDMAGRVLSYGEAAHHGDLFGVAEDTVDIARTATGDGYWLLRKNGTVTAYGDAVHHGNATVTGTMPSGGPIIARSIESHPSTSGYWVLRSDGVVQAFNLTHLGNAARTGLDVSIYGRAAFDTAEYVASIRRTHTGDGYWITSGGGIVQGFGDAFLRGHVTKGIAEQWSRRLCWDIIPSSVDDTGLAVIRADGNLSIMGNWSPFGSIGEGSGERRLTGNYTDYTQIVRDLLLWAGFYFYPETAPSAEMPAVYGNLETTGAYATVDLPLGMFDKKPIIEAIKDLKKIVGYIFRVDPEGGAVWASPNWWTMGNFLADRTPFSYMPEIDEAVQMLSHGVTFSAQSARSSITIATSDPLPGIAGADDPTGVVITTLNDPASAKDLRGMISPFVWWNGLFLKPAEQRIMADLLDMQIWFQRRLAQVSCVANPLIDIDDQVRIFERTTGEAYVHYVTGINFTHDLMSGDYTMNLTTHWMGGNPWGKQAFFFAGADRPGGAGYFQVNAFGSVYAYGTAETYIDHESDSHLDWVIGLRSTPSGTGYYSVDTSGKILTYGNAVHRGELHRSTKDVVDMALTPSGLGYWLLQKDGTVTSFGDATSHGNANVTFIDSPATTAVSIESHPSTSGYWILLADGEVQAFNLTHYGDFNWTGYDIREAAARLRRSSGGNGYWICSNTGGVQAFGAAPDRGGHRSYPAGLDSDRLSTDLIVNEATNGYALQHADGSLTTFGFTNLGQSSEVHEPSHPLWPIVTATTYSGLDHPEDLLPVSLDLMSFLQKTGSKSANNAVANNFGTPTDPTAKAL